MDEHELEEMMRAGLERRADDADVTAPVVARARAEVSRRRRTRHGVVGAAAAVVLVVGGVAAVTSRSGDDAKPQLPVADDSPTTDAQPPATGEWRTEYWRGVAVDVPADWAYGGAPVESGGDIVACYPEAMVGADGRRLRQSGDRGWVGRPIGVTDVCALYPWLENSPEEEPAAPYVWLGAAVEPGVVEYANGVVEETIEVEGVTVTVASDDAELRKEILGNARAADGSLCEPRKVNAPEALDGWTFEGRGALQSAEVCAYTAAESGFVLSYAADVSVVAAERAIGAEEAAPRSNQVCDAIDFEFVILHAIYADPTGGELHRTIVYDMGCGGTVDVGGAVLEPGKRQLVREGVEPWADNGIPAVVYGPTGGKGAMIDSFIGLLG